MDDLNLGVLIIGSIILIGLIQLLTWAVMVKNHSFIYLNPELPPGGSSNARSHS